MGSEEERERHLNRIRRKRQEKKEAAERRAEKKGAFSLKENKHPEYRREKLRIRDISIGQEDD